MMFSIVLVLAGTNMALISIAISLHRITKTLERK